MLCIHKMFLLCLRCAMNKLRYCVYTLTPLGVQSRRSILFTGWRALCPRLPRWRVYHTAILARGKIKQHDRQVTGGVNMTTGECNRVWQQERIIIDCVSNFTPRKQQRNEKQNRSAISCSPQRTFRITDQRLTFLKIVFKSSTCHEWNSCMQIVILLHSQ